MGSIFLTLAAFLGGLVIQQTGDPRAVLRARLAECAIGTVCLVVGTVLAFMGYR